MCQRCSRSSAAEGNAHLHTIPAEIITDLTWCRFVVFELVSNCNDCNSMRFNFFELTQNRNGNKFPCGIFPCSLRFRFGLLCCGSHVQASLLPKFALLFCSCPQCRGSGRGVTTSSSSCSSSWTTTRSWRSLARIGSTCSTGTPLSRTLQCA